MLYRLKRRERIPDPPLIELLVWTVRMDEDHKTCNLPAWVRDWKCLTASENKGALLELLERLGLTMGAFSQ